LRLHGRNGAVPPENLRVVFSCGRLQNPVDCDGEIIWNRVRVFGERLDQLEVQACDRTPMEVTEQKTSDTLAVGAREGLDPGEHRLADDDPSPTAVSRLQRREDVVWVAQWLPMDRLLDRHRSCRDELTGHNASHGLATDCSHESASKRHLLRVSEACSRFSSCRGRGQVVGAAPGHPVAIGAQRATKCHDWPDPSHTAAHSRCFANVWRSGYPIMLGDCKTSLSS
jgi:hypothetical protein